MSERIPTEQAERLLADLLDARRERDEARAELERERARRTRQR